MTQDSESALQQEAGQAVAPAEESGVGFRRAVPADARAIAEFNARMARETEDLELDAAILLPGVEAALGPDVRSDYFVAEANGAIVGQTMMTYEWSDWRNGEIWWFQSVFVDPAWRRKGVFRQLFEYVREEGLRAGAIGFRLYVVEGNKRAQAAYRSLGMLPTEYVVWEWMPTDIRPSPAE